MDAHRLPNPTRRRGMAAGLALLGAGLLLLTLTTPYFLDWLSTLAEDTPSAVPARVRAPAPELELVDLSGQTVSLADYRGSVVLVNHWATWCPPCRAEMPALEAYHQRHHQQGFSVIAIDSGEPPAVVARYIDDHGFTFPVWLDPHLSALAAFQYPGLPTSYVIDRTGTVRLMWTGAIDQVTLEQYVTPLLEERAWIQR